MHSYRRYKKNQADLQNKLKISQKLTTIYRFHRRPAMLDNVPSDSGSNWPDKVSFLATNPAPHNTRCRSYFICSATGNHPDHLDYLEITWISPGLPGDHWITWKSPRITWLLLVCVPWTITGQPRNSVFIPRPLGDHLDYLTITKDHPAIARITRW